MKEELSSLSHQTRKIIPTMIVSGLLFGCLSDNKKTQIHTQEPEPIVVQKPQPKHIPTYPIHITIDDGPRPRTVEMAKILSEHNHQGTFFFVGEQIERYFDEAVEVAKMGHIIANHSYQHHYYSHMTLEQAIADCEKTNALIRKVIETAGSDQQCIPFRYPGGIQVRKRYRPQFNEYLQNNGQNTYFRGERDIKDRKKHSPMNSDSIAKFLLDAKSEEILLMHDLHQKSADGLKQRDSINQLDTILRAKSVGLK